MKDGIRATLAALWFLFVLWSFCWFIEGKDILKVWWGFPFIITSLYVGFGGVLFILFRRGG